MTSTRTARHGDWPQLWLLLSAMGGVDSEGEARRRFERLLTQDDWFIAVAAEDGNLVGYAAAQDFGDHLRAGRRGRVARMHDVFVAAPARQRGVGSALVAAVVDWARDRVAYLQWQAHESRAAPFYERLGYQGNPCPQPDYPQFEIAFE